MNIVCRCSCGGVQTYMESSIKALGLSAPQKVYVGKEKIRAFRDSVPEGTLKSHLEVIAKKSGRYVFYVSYNDEYEITGMYNLITGKKVY